VHNGLQVFACKQNNRGEAGLSLMTLMGSVASVVVTSVMAETVGTSGVFLADKLVHSFTIALSTNLLTAFADGVSMSIVANSLGKLSLKK